LLLCPDTCGHPATGGVLCVSGDLARFEGGIEMGFAIAIVVMLVALVVVMSALLAVDRHIRNRPPLAPTIKQDIAEAVERYRTELYQ
jgi:hypothetical protein